MNRSVEGERESVPPVFIFLLLLFWSMCNQKEQHHRCVQVVTKQLNQLMKM